MSSLTASSSCVDDSLGTQRASLPVRIAILLTVLLPFVGLIVGIFFLWEHGFGWVDLILLLVMYHLTGLGITLGYHRLFTHRSFETTWPVRLALGVLGSMAVQGPLLKWVAVHRRHHQHSDEPGDPHSPHLHGRGLFAMLRGLVHAHTGWLFSADFAGLDRYVRDLSRDRMLRVVSALFPLWVLMGLLIPAVLGGLLTMTWFGAMAGFIWGGLVRVFLVHHVTWSINSVCHLWGGRPFSTQDESRNNVVFGIMCLGEGWHNNHHAFPTSARHGLRWWELDITYLLIRLLGSLRLAWNVRVPATDAMAVRFRPA